MTNTPNLSASELLMQLESRLHKTLPNGKLKSYALPLCPELSLYLFDPDALAGPLSHEEAHRVVESPAYWSFCWASGQVLASYLLRNPAMVTGKSVLDFGSGSGVVAIAAHLAGARKVTACDIDPDALLACRANAKLNQVELDYTDNFKELDPTEIDLICASDVLYDPENLELLGEFRAISDGIVLADSRIKVLPDPSYIQKDCIEARTYPDLNEFEEFNQVRIYLA